MERGGRDGERWDMFVAFSRGEQSLLGVMGDCP
jgi:hypothetical protein